MGKSERTRNDKIQNEQKKNNKGKTRFTGTSPVAIAYFQALRLKGVSLCVMRNSACQACPKFNLIPPDIDASEVLQ